MSQAKKLDVNNCGIIRKPSSLRLAWPPPKDAVIEKTLNQNEVDTIIAAARAEERKMIGQELHDNVNQILMTVKLYMGMIQHVKKEYRGIQQKSLSYLMLAIDEIRSLSGEFINAKGKQENLLHNINTIVDDISFSTSIKIEFNHDGDIESMRMDKKQALLRIVQEQLKNIVKYSEANRVSIDLIYRAGEAFLQVKDNGIGFDPSKKREGIGLCNIYERTHMLDGHVDLQTGPGQGCTMSIFLPA